MNQYMQAAENPFIQCHIMAHNGTQWPYGHGEEAFLVRNVIKTITTT